MKTNLRSTWVVSLAILNQKFKYTYFYEHCLMYGKLGMIVIVVSSTVFEQQSVSWKYMKWVAFLHHLHRKWNKILPNLTTFPTRYACHGDIYVNTHLRDIFYYRDWSESGRSEIIWSRIGSYRSGADRPISYIQVNQIIIDETPVTTLTGCESLKFLKTALSFQRHERRVFQTTLLESFRAN